MQSIRASLRWYDALFLLLAIAGVGLYALTANGGFPLDDSWIHQVYGRNLAEHGEWAFVPGEPSAASTSPLYTVLVAVGYVLHVDYALWTHVWGALALAGIASLGARLVSHLVTDTLTPVIAGLTLIVTWHLLWAAASGMETALFSMWALALILLMWREYGQESGFLARGGVFGLIAALAMLTRPEGVMLAGLCGLALLAVRPGRNTLLWSAGAGIGFGVLIAPYLLLNLNLTGGVLPATSDAKFAQHAPILAESYLLRVLSMVIPIIAGGQVLLLPGFVYFMFKLLRNLRTDRAVWLHLLPVVWVVALILLYAARLPASYQHGRYVIPALPALIVAGVIGTRWLLLDTRKSMVGRVLVRSLAISAGAAFLYFGLILGPDVYDQDVAIIDEEMVASAQWIAENIPNDDFLAVHDIGAVGYFAPRLILDIAGLITPEVVPIYWDEAGLWAFIEDRDAVYLMAFPDQLPGKGGVNPQNDPRLCPVFQSSGRTSISVGGPKMTVYRINWNGGGCRG